MLYAVNSMPMNSNLGLLSDLRDIKDTYHIHSYIDKSYFAQIDKPAHCKTKGFCVALSD